MDNENIEIKSLGSWIVSNQLKYKIKKEIMKNEDIYNKWTEFINSNKYKIYFEDYLITWINNLEKVKTYIDKNNMRPTSCNENIDIKSLGSWILLQISTHKNKKAIMKNEEIYNKWTNFINDDKYKKYF